MESAQSVESLMLASLLKVSMNDHRRLEQLQYLRNIALISFSTSQARYIEAMVKSISAYKPCWTSRRGGSLNQVVPFW
jgi:hypothetical protein